MGSLKRKEGPAGSSASKFAKSTTDPRPSKRSKSDKTSKDEGQPSSRTAAVPLISKLKEEEPMFPRGGGSVLSPLEHKQIQIQAKRDVLFEQESTASARKREKTSQKKRKAAPKSEDKLPGRFAKDQDAVQIESLNYKRLVKGSLVLGQVYHINPLDVVVALPNSLIGHVSITAVSQGLTERLQASAGQDEDEEADADDEKESDDVDLKSLFEIGQYVRAYVVSTTDEESAAGTKTKRHIELSLQPDLANSGLTAQDVVENCTLMASVASVEDHGFVMDLGIPNSKLRGFLPKKQLDPSIAAERLQPGSAWLCVVSGKNTNGKIVQVSTLKDRLHSNKKYPADATSIGTFLPGTMADVLVSEVSSRGIVGKVLGHLDVTADRLHSGASLSDEGFETKHKVGSRVKARIICTFPTADIPKLGVSILPHVAAMEPKTTVKDGLSVPPLKALPSSSLVESCKVTKVDLGVGLYLDVGVKDVPGFVHISRVKDGKIDALFENSGPYKLGSVHPGRVIGYNALDGLFLISLEKHILEQPFLRIEDIPVGEVVTGTVEKIVIKPDGVGGLLVNIAEGISGLVPEMHLADIHLQHPEKKFREGMKVKARVLSTNPSRHQLRLTLAKTLVNSDKPPIKSYDELSIGLQALGTIMNILQHGAIVQFYGQLRGFLPVSEMSEAYIRDPKEHFRVGQVVGVHVLSFDPEAKRLILSCKDPSAFGLEKQLALKNLKLGDIVSAKVTQKTEDDVYVELADGALKALLPVGHLTDHSSHKAQSALKKLHAGQTLSDLVVLQKNESRRSIIVSNKPSLVQASRDGKLLTSVEDARVGDILQGFIRNITPTAAFVDFAGRVTALLPKSKMPRESQDQEKFGLRNFQPILVKITSVDRDNGRVVVAIPSVSNEPPTKLSEAEANEPVVNPVDESIISLDDLAIGKITKAQVVSIKSSQLNVRLADNIQGRIDVSQAFDQWEEILDWKHPLKRFKAKDIIDVRVLGVHDARNHRFLPISHRSGHSVLELSMKPSGLREGANPEPLVLESLEVGSTQLAFVNAVRQGCLWVNLSPSVRGRIQTTEIADDYSRLKDLEKSYPIGSALRVRVLSVDVEHSHLDLSARSFGSVKEKTWDNIGQGMVLGGKITKVNDRQIMVKLSESLAAPVHMVDMADDYDEANPLAYSRDDIVLVAVVELDKSNKKMRLSTRPSRVLNSSLPVKDKEITKDSKIKAGDITRGFVKNVSDKGLFVSLGGDVVAMVKIRDASDKFLKDWKEHFQVDQVVKGRIVAVTNGRIDMSLKKSVVEKEYTPLTTIADLTEGQEVTGVVRKVEEFGAFIEIDGSQNVRGLCHRTEMAEKFVPDPRKLYNEGDKVKARVLKVDAKQRRISLGLKPSYFEGGNESDLAMESDEDEGAALDSEEDDEQMADTGGAVLITGTDNIEDSEEDEVDNDEDADSDVDMKETSLEGLGGLDAGGFDWSAGALDADADKDADMMGIEEPIKKTRKRRELEIQIDKTGELDAYGPQTSSDFERLLLGQPDSSQLWIAYMAFQMQVSELDKAREVAERAIKTINVREETEKLNVWIAYLNLEVAYGTEETVEEVFQRACAYNDEQEVYERLASIYIQSNKREKADGLFEAMLKKFGSKSPDVWTNYAHFLHATANQPDRARALMKRASQALGTSTHVYLPLIAKFAALEYRSSNGDHEQGRTLFESLLATYPKKFDVWNQLVDLEMSAFLAASEDRDPAVVRDIFERGTKAKGLKPKQAKVWFRRWAKFEEEHGDAKHRETVSAKAQEWTKAAERRKQASKTKADEEEEDGE